MKEKCLTCKSLFDQKPVDYRKPDYHDNQYNYGNCDDCELKEQLKFLKKNRKLVPVYVTRIQKKQDPLDEKTKKEIRDFFIQEYYKVNSPIKRKNDIYPLIRKKFGLGLTKEYMACLLRTKSLQNLGYKITFFRTKQINFLKQENALDS